jgi:hypothetical protein
MRKKAFLCAKKSNFKRNFIDPIIIFFSSDTTIVVDKNPDFKFDYFK